MFATASFTLACCLLAAAAPNESADLGVPASAPQAESVSLAARAGDDALQKLLDAAAALLTIHNGVSQPVAGVLAFSPEAELEWRGLVAASCTAGKPRQTKPGVVAVDMSISTEHLTKLLRDALAGRWASGLVIGPVAGSTAGSTVVASGTAYDDGPVRDSRPGWRHCTQRDIIMASKAAEHDLRRQVLARLQRIVLSNGQTLGQLARRQPRLDAALAEKVERITGDAPVFLASGTCVVAGTMGAERLTDIIDTALREAGTEPAAGLQPGELREAMIVRGFSVAPPRSAPNRIPIDRGPRPDWAARTISSTATAAGPTNEPDVVIRNELAAKAARVEALRQLWMEIEKLELPSGRTVGEAIAAHADRDAVIQAVSGAVFVMSKPSVDGDGVATIVLGIQLQAVWQAVGR